MSMLLLAMAKAVRLKRARRLCDARHSGTEPVIIILLLLCECHPCPVRYAIFYPGLFCLSLNSFAAGFRFKAGVKRITVIRILYQTAV